MTNNKEQLGFTILEVLVAFLVSALLLTIILSGFSQGLSNLRLLEQRAEAATIAQSRLAEVSYLFPLYPATYTGIVHGNPSYRWEIKIEPLRWEFENRVSSLGMSLYKIEANVYWKFSNIDKSLTLNTLRLSREIK